MQLTPQSIAMQYGKTQAEIDSLAHDICIMMNVAYNDAAAIACEVKENQSGATYLIAEEIEQQINAMKLTVTA